MIIELESLTILDFETKEYLTIGLLSIQPQIHIKTKEGTALRKAIEEIRKQKEKDK